MKKTRIINVESKFSNRHEKVTVKITVLEDTIKRGLRIKRHKRLVKEKKNIQIHGEKKITL